MSIFADSSTSFHSTGSFVEEEAISVISGNYSRPCSIDVVSVTSASSAPLNNEHFAAILHNLSIRDDRPLCIDLFCGLGGWSQGFLAEGYRVVGFDIERHRYQKTIPSEDADYQKSPVGLNAGGMWKDRFATGPRDTAAKLMQFVDGWDEYPGELVLQDVLTLHGSQFRDAAVIVASPPCQEYSYMAMPWSRGKQIAGALREEVPFPEGYTGSRTVEQLTALFNACFRIQREACEAAGRYIPLVVENVRGAEPWVGPAKGRYGSFYLWGDIESVGGRLCAPRARFGQTVAPQKALKFNPDGTEHPQGSWFAIADSKNRGAAQKVPGFNFHEFEKTGQPGRSFQSTAVKGFVTGLGRDHDWRQDPSARFNSKSSARKAASAQIAKIPLALSQWVARVYKPAHSQEVAV